MLVDYKILLKTMLRLFMTYKVEEQDWSAICQQESISSMEKFLLQNEKNDSW